MRSNWWKWHNDRLLGLYTAVTCGMIKLTRIRWAGHVARMGEENRPLVRTRRTYKNNIKKGLNKIGGRAVA